MIDLACILFTTLMILLVIYRAVVLDGSLPWFRPTVPRDALVPETGRRNGRQAPADRTVINEPPSAEKSPLPRTLPTSWREASEKASPREATAGRQSWRDRRTLPHNMPSWRR
jgi:hypothetical protein